MDEPARLELAGLTFAGIPDGWHPVNAILIIECVDTKDEDTGAGMMRLCTRANDELTTWAAIGMLSATRQDLETQYVASLRDV